MNWFLAIVLVSLVYWAQGIPFERANLEKVAQAIAQVDQKDDTPTPVHRVGATANNLSAPMFYQQKLDHFDLKNKATWQQVSQLDFDSYNDR